MRSEDVELSTPCILHPSPPRSNLPITTTTSISRNFITSIDGSSYTTIQEVIKNLYPNELTILALTSLHIHSTTLQILNGIESYQNLIILDLSKNQIHNPEPIFGTTLVALRYLNLSQNCLYGFTEYAIPTSCSMYAKDMIQKEAYISPKRLEALKCSRTVATIHQLQMNLPALEFLILNENFIETMDDLLPLKECTMLQYLSIKNNPVSEAPDYRKHIAEMLPMLRCLDCLLVSDHEKYPVILTESLKQVPFISKLYETLQHSQPETNQRLLQVLHNDSRQLIHLYERNSPVLLCQRCIRGWRTRRKVFCGFSSRLGFFRLVRFIQIYIRRWLRKLQLRNELYEILKASDNLHLLISTLALRKEERVRSCALKWRQNAKHRHEERSQRKLVAWFYRTYPKYKRRKKETLKNGMLVYFNEHMKEIFYELLVKQIQCSEGRDRDTFESRLVDMGVTYSIGPLGKTIRFYRTMSSIRTSSWETMIKILQEDLRKINEIHRRLSRTDHEILKEHRRVDSMRQTITRLQHAQGELGKARDWEEVFRDSPRRPAYKPFIFSHVCDRLKYPISKRVSTCMNEKENNMSSERMFAYCFHSYGDYLRCQIAMQQYLSSDEEHIIYYSYSAMHESNATLLIQSLWRSYKVRRRKNLQLYILRQRASILLQRWWRFHIGLYRRLRFIKIVHLLSKLITSDHLYIQTELLHILRERTFLSRASTLLQLEGFPRLSYDITDAYTATISQETPLDSTSSAIYRLPQWSTKRVKMLGSSTWIDDRLDDLLAQGTSLRPGGDIVTDGVNTMEVTEIVFPTVEEARIRVLILFAMTFDIKTNFFIALYTEKMLKTLLTALRNDQYDEHWINTFINVFPFSSTTLYKHMINGIARTATSKSSSTRATLPFINLGRSSKSLDASTNLLDRYLETPPGPRVYKESSNVPHPPVRPRSPFNYEYTPSKLENTTAEKDEQEEHRQNSAFHKRQEEQRLQRALDIEKKLKACEITMENARLTYEKNTNKVLTTFTKEIEKNKQLESRLEERILKEEKKERFEKSKQLNRGFLNIARRIQTVAIKQEKDLAKQQIQQTTKEYRSLNQVRQLHIKEEKMYTILTKQTERFKDNIARH